MWIVEATEQRHVPNVHAVTSSEVAGPGVMDFAMMIANGMVTTVVVYARGYKKSTRVSSTHETDTLQGDCGGHGQGWVD